MDEVRIVYFGPLVSRKEALKSGLTNYFNAVPCKHGHIAQRTTNRSFCTECRRLAYHSAIKSDPDYGRESKLKYIRSARGKERRRLYEVEHKEHIKNKKAEYNIANAERIQKQKADWKIRNKEVVLARNAEKRKVWQNDPNLREKELKKNKDYRDLRLLKAAGRPKPEVCEVCGGNHHRPGIFFDHCHSTGIFRGWICDRCNKTLGMVKDSAELLRKLAEYLEVHDDKVNNIAA